MWSVSNVDSWIDEWGPWTDLGIARESLIVGVQNVTTALDNVHGDLVPKDLREGVKKVLVEQIEQLRGELNTRRASTANNKGQETLALVITSRGQASKFHVLQNLVLDLPGIVDRLQEVAVVESLNAVGVGYTTYRIGELVSRNITPTEGERVSNVPTPITNLS